MRVCMCAHVRGSNKFSLLKYRGAVASSVFAGERVRRRSLHTRMMHGELLRKVLWKGSKAKEAKTVNTASTTSCASTATTASGAATSSAGIATTVSGAMAPAQWAAMTAASGGDAEFYPTAPLLRYASYEDYCMDQGTVAGRNFLERLQMEECDVNVHRPFKPKPSRSIWSVLSC